LRDARNIALTAGNGPEPDEDDDQQAGQLDHCENHIGFHALANAAEIHRRHDRHECQGSKRDTDTGFKIELERLGKLRKHETPSMRR
jgi:hypothetical protein